MGEQIRVLAIAGSAREASLNRKLLRVAARGAEQAGARVELIELRDFPMPLYDGDLEARDGLPVHAKRLKQRFIESDALLIATPEYNGSLPPLLKNALDWVSRREGEEGPLRAFTGKTAVIMAASPGNLGGLRCLAHLRQILSGINVLVLPQQKAVPRAAEAFDEAGDLHDATVRGGVEQLGALLVETTAKLKG